MLALLVVFFLLLQIVPEPLLIPLYCVFMALCGVQLIRVLQKYQRSS